MCVYMCVVLGSPTVCVWGGQPYMSFGRNRFLSKDNTRLHVHLQLGNLMT